MELLLLKSYSKIILLCSKRVDLNLFFSSEEIKKIEEMISNYPETKENWFKLTQAISNHNIGDIFRQLEQIQIEIDQYSNLTK